MNRQDKILCITAFLLTLYDNAVLDRYHYTFTSEDVALMRPDDITAVLTLLEQQPNCLAFKYENLYKDKQEVLDSEDPILNERFNAIEPVVDAEDKQKWDNLIKYYLGVVKYDVTIFDGFMDRVAALVNNDTLPSKVNENSVALELKKNGDSIVVYIDGHEYPINNHLSQGSLFDPLMEYAFRHQGEEFKLSDINEQTSYKNHNALQRIFGDPKIYRAFFKVNGDNGSLVANFKPTYKDLKERNTSVEEIRRLVKC